MCMCWSGYLSTHVSMMNSLGCNHLNKSDPGPAPHAQKGADYH